MVIARPQGQLVLFPKVRGASSKIILAVHLNGIKDPRRHSIYMLSSCQKE